MTTMNYNKALEDAHRYVDYAIESANAEIARFIDRAARTGVTDAIAWRGEATMVAEYVKDKAQFLKDSLSKIQTDEDVKNAIERIKAIRDRFRGVPGR